jgi:uncharacterized membrane protein YphA (DoxX/SURF4 family)
MRTTSIHSSPDVAPRARRRRIGQRELTALRILLAIEFAGAGLMKLAGASAYCSRVSPAWPPSGWPPS